MHGGALQLLATGQALGRWALLPIRPGECTDDPARRTDHAGAERGHWNGVSQRESTKNIAAVSVPLKISGSGEKNIGSNHDPKCVGADKRNKYENPHNGKPHHDERQGKSKPH